MIRSARGSSVRGHHAGAGRRGALELPRLGVAVLALALPLLLARVVAASPVIEVRFSVKVIRDSLTNVRPPMDGSGRPVTDARIQWMIETANDSLLATYSRGYRFRITEIVDVGSACSGCDSSNPTFWSNATLAGDWDMKRFENWAKSYPAFQWRTNAVNVYVTRGKGNGAVASFPPPDARSNDIVVVGSYCFDTGFAPLFSGSILHHEIGHYFSLPHPNGSIDTCCTYDCITDGDQIEDTLPDGPCFTLDQLSTYRYGAPFAAVNAAKQDSLLDMFWNNMCYLHPDQRDGPGEGYGKTILPRMTELQLDRWTDTANGIRAGVVSGRTRFVNAAGCGICAPASGTSTDPFIGIGDALGAAVPGDILLLRPGTYVGPTWINQPVTIRATRKGAARITY